MRLRLRLLVCMLDLLHGLLSIHEPDIVVIVVIVVIVIIDTLVARYVLI